MDRLLQYWRNLRRTWPRATVLLPTTVGLALPLIVAVIALSSRRWYPVLDLAMTEFRIRDVGTRHTPLIGLPGRIGEFPDQGSHPGPLSFWLLAPGYRLFGSTAWAMEASTMLIQAVWIGVALWIADRRGGLTAVAVASVVIAVLIRGYGLSVLTQPWNPYLPLIAWVVVLLATWSVVVGDHRMLIPLAVAASFAAQTHIPYLMMAGGLGAGAAVLVLVRWWRSEHRGPLPRPLLATAAVFGGLWLPPIVDQVRRDPGNFRRLLDHFGDPPEEAIGFGKGLTLLLRHLDVARGLGGSLIGSQRFVDLGQEESATAIPGLVVLLIWIVAVVVARRLPESPMRRPLLSLHAVIAATLLLSWISMARIFGNTWFYLTLWAWATTTLLVVSVLWTVAVWTVAVWLGDRTEGRLATVTLRSSIAVAAVATLSMIALAPATDHPEEYLGDTLGEVVDPTAQALADGVGDAVGPNGRYVVFWTDAHSFGSQGFGLVNELERLGFDVGVYDAWRVPVTQQRVFSAADADAEVIWATGRFVDVWRADARVVEVASVEPRSPAELDEFESLRSTLITDLTATGLDDLVPLVDNNLFGVRIDERISDIALDASKRMLDLDQNAAVFIGPAGVSQ